MINVKHIISFLLEASFQDALSLLVAQSNHVYFFHELFDPVLLLKYISNFKSFQIIDYIIIITRAQ